MIQIPPALALAAMALIAPAAPTPEPPPHGPVPTRVVRTEAGYELHRGGEPYFIRGVGGTSRLERLAAAGGNSIRTWDAEGMRPLLDEAHAHGLSVALGLWLQHERHGFDYDDPSQRAAQLDRVRALVVEHKDHPALLLWGVGNEVELEGDMDKALRFVEEAAAIVKALDPNHPTMAVVAEIGGDKARLVQDRCPNIDILGINSYAGLTSIPQRLTEQGFTKPYIVTEFGVPGHWEVAKTPWGAPIEPASAEKAAAYERNYRGGILAEHPGRCLGSYAFLWGHKQETTGTWFGMFLPTGESAPTVDTMHTLWTGSPPANRAPEVRGIAIEGHDRRYFAPGSVLRLTAQAADPDGDEVECLWELRHESTDRRSGGDAEARPDVIEGVFSEPDGLGVTLRIPDEPGPYRIFLRVRDPHHQAGTANLPILVRTGQGG